MDALDAILLRYTSLGVALAFSGGVDSRFLAWRLTQLHIPFCKVTLCVPLLNIPEVVANVPARCYYCKKAMMKYVAQKGREQGFSIVMDGTNADDLGQHRPGLRALAECCVVSPLAEAGLTKTMIRHQIREVGLPFADDPASPCLATRFDYGTILTTERLMRVGKAEDFLRTIAGSKVDLRVRCEGDDANHARIEVSLNALPCVQQMFSAVQAFLHGLGFASVELDKRGYCTRS